MKTILDLNNTDAKKFFLKESSYCSFELPKYFSFQQLLTTLSLNLENKALKDTHTNENNPACVEGVNYMFYNNKDGKFAWRPFQLIHPVIYILLVQKITEDGYWQLIQERFKNFENRRNGKIECQSIPVAEGNGNSRKQNQIFEWWEKVEQQSLAFSLEFNDLLHLDITDCYGSIYTHSIAWALHERKDAKGNRNNKDLIGNIIDEHIRAMSYGQTNGIPQGSVLMDFIAEIVLGYGDLLLAEKLKNHSNIGEYKIIRYRDDYRIFTNSSQQSSIIAKVLSEVLSTLNFKINSTKTHSTNDLVLGSLKPDKVHWIYNKRKTDNIQQWLIQISILAKEYPNSGSLYKEAKCFLNWIEKNKRLKSKNIEVLISILVNITYNNSRLFALAIGSLSFLISKVEGEKQQKEILEKIKNKFEQLPNTDYLNIWLQRLTIKIDPIFSYSGKLCQKVSSENELIWDSNWLKKEIKDIVEGTEIINREFIKEMEPKFSKKEIESLEKYDKLYL